MLSRYFYVICWLGFYYFEDPFPVWAIDNTTPWAMPFHTVLLVPTVSDNMAELQETTK